MNKRIIMLGIALLAFIPSVISQKIKLQNTIKIETTDSHEVIINKAAHVVPTKNQLEALRKEYIAFIHFGPNTFTRKEWGDGMEDPAIFDLKNLDTDQWCQVMKEAGMKLVMLTVKHHDGFVLWQSRYTKHGIMSTGFQNGQGDILKELSASCKKYGLKLGIYMSPADLYQIEHPDGLYGNLSKYSKRSIPREVEGRPFANKTKFEFVVDDYNEYFLNQLFEVLTEYGDVDEVWFDGAHPKRKGGQTYNYPAWRELIRTLAPNAVIFGREDIRWCGNEAGATRDTEWNVVTYPVNPDTTSHFPDMTLTDLGSREMLYKGKYLHYQPAETNTSIREGWFYRDETHQKVRSADDVFDMYERSVGGNSIFLLNIPPNREGKFSPADVESLIDAGKRIRETYGSNLFANAKGPKKVLDNNPNTYLVLKKNKKEIVINMAEERIINRLMIQEAIASHSERVERHAVDAWIDGAWKEITTSTNIGYKRILRFPEVKTSKIRLRILESRLNPAISHISAHYYEARPPRLDISRNLEGKLSISAKTSDFGWKPHGEDLHKNLSSAYKIFYTLDGTEPTIHSKLYENSFIVEGKTVRALAISNDKKGAVETQEFGLIKKAWTILDVSSESENFTAEMAIDADSKSFWQTKEADDKKQIAIDLGKESKLKAFVYTPQTKNSEGMMEKGLIQISSDGKTWNTVENFEFGNLINDPSPRVHYFEKIQSARYIRVQATQLAANSKVLSIAELDFLIE